MIFLSASVPQPDREFYGTENVFAIKEAIISFVRVCAEKKTPVLLWRSSSHNTLGLECCQKLFWR